MKKFSFWVCFFLLFSFSAFAFDPHVHGISKVELSLFEKKITMDLDSPANDVLGFEHEPANAEERKILRRTVSDLKNWRKLFSLGKDANCRATRFESDLEEEIEELHEYDDDHEDGHFDSEAEYRISCKNFGRIDRLDASGFFQRFPHAEKIIVEWASAKNFSVGELTRENPSMEIQLP